MLGNNYRCSLCPFEFSCGWSHHVGGQFLVCPGCGEQFILANPRSCWGVKDGDQLELMDATEVGQTPIGIRVTATNLKPESDTEWDGVCLLRFDDIACPSCGSAALVQTLPEGNLCPSCHKGVIVAAGTCIY